jgi:hypothetical protein
VVWAAGVVVGALPVSRLVTVGLLPPMLFFLTLQALAELTVPRALAVVVDGLERCFPWWCRSRSMGDRAQRSSPEVGRWRSGETWRYGSSCGRLDWELENLDLDLGFRHEARATYKLAAEGRNRPLVLKCPPRRS